MGEAPKPAQRETLEEQQPYGNQGPRENHSGAAKEVPAGDRGEHSGVNKQDEEDARGVPGIGAPPPA